MKGRGAPGQSEQFDDFQDNIDAFSADFSELVALISNEDVVELGETVEELQIQLKDVGLME